MSYDVFVVFSIALTSLLNCFVFCLADLDDPQSTSSKQHTTDMSEGRITPTASSGMLTVLFILRIIIVKLFVVVQVQIRFFLFLSNKGQTKQFYTRHNDWHCRIYIKGNDRE